MQANINRLRWQCRRGMLELDLLLIPFFDRYYLGLSASDKLLFERLLSYEDQDLYRILIKRHAPIEDSRLYVLVEKIICDC
ncbi:MAG: succinate dehydrogenase assembly factor 2 [Rickettsiella sp.]|nr:succinate dehydrogenase assembly factor 2 [Rickettsiella sp.]